MLTPRQRRGLAQAANDAVGRVSRCTPTVVTCPAPALMRTLARRRRWPYGACPAPGCTLAAGDDGRCTLHRERAPLKLSNDRDVHAVVQRGVMTFSDALPPLAEPLPVGWHEALPPHAPCNGCAPRVHALRGRATAYVTADRRCRLCGCAVRGVIGPPDVTTTTCQLCLRFSRHRPPMTPRVNTDAARHPLLPGNSVDPVAECWRMIERARANAGQKPLAITRVSGGRSTYVDD